MVQRQLPDTVTLTIRWGDTVVVHHRLAAGQDATVGAAPDTHLAIPRDALGQPILTVASWREGGFHALVPRDVVAFRERPGAIPSPLCGPADIPLERGESVSFALAAFLITITSDTPPPRAWASSSPLRAALLTAPCLAIATLAHAGVLALSAGSARAASLDEEPTANLEMAHYLAAAEARTAANEQSQSASPGAGDAQGQQVNDREGNGKVSGGARAAGREGDMGSAAQRDGGHRRYAVAKADGAAQQSALSREEALADARSFGVVGVLAAGAPRSPHVSFGQEAARGPDSLSARGDLWAASMGETFGSGGLGLSGTGEGGGGRFEGLGLGVTGDVGHDLGLGGSGSGGVGGRTRQARWADSSWRRDLYSCVIGTRPTVIPGDESTSQPEPEPTVMSMVRHGAPSIRSLKASVAADEIGVAPDSAALPQADAIRRVVQRANGNFRRCYESAVKWDSRRGEADGPSGDIVTTIVVGERGQIISASNGGGSLALPDVVHCATWAFLGLSFPERPNGGLVAISYPLSFGWPASK